MKNCWSSLYIYMHHVAIPFFFKGTPGKIWIFKLCLPVTKLRDVTLFKCDSPGSVLGFCSFLFTKFWSKNYWIWRIWVGDLDLLVVEEAGHIWSAWPHEVKTNQMIWSKEITGYICSLTSASWVPDNELACAWCARHYTRQVNNSHQTAKKATAKQLCNWAIFLCFVSFCWDFAMISQLLCLKLGQANDLLKDSSASGKTRLSLSSQSCQLFYMDILPNAVSLCVPENCFHLLVSI